MRTAGGFHGRRIQKTGGSTFIISLPKSWVVERGLSAGDVLQFMPRSDGSLAVYAEEGPAATSPRRTIVIDNEMPAEHLFRRLVAEYIAGVPLLELRSRGRMGAGTREVIRGFAQRMIGPEILEESSDSVILQDVIGPNPLPIPSVIRRMHQMVRAMQGDAMTAFRSQDSSLARDVIERDWEVDRLHWFVGKQVTTALRDARTLASIGLSLPECATYLLASRVLERIADHAVRIAGTVDLLGRERLPEEPLKELERVANVAAAALGDALDSLERRDIERANAVLDAVGQLPPQREKILRQIGTKRGRLAVALAYVFESLERSALYASDLAEIAINHAVEVSPNVPPP
ncbi:MAG: phosphate uptake regulator PhoU [Thermoplasmata archaeon]|nr:phosphate uptake regulator PhoU [Thermoplasmata archaeon]MCI4338508.1 phosphate uptake regulator PhoU [Thermoplasmata archaeon]MCI4341354.1 phosphate uptake regulator PhoU [Thermoplasmata archaeon]